MALPIPAAEQMGSFGQKRDRNKNPGAVFTGRVRHTSRNYLFYYNRRNVRVNKNLPHQELPMPAKPRGLIHPDIKAENTPALASRYLDVPNMPWEKTRFAGIEIKVLYSDASGITTALFKLAPGAVVPLHEHTALEQTFVLEGTLEDHEGLCGPGQFVWRPAGNRHEAVAPNGAVILGFFLKPNRFAEGDKFFTE
jgi:quercetin dioxygenase-like cupin family protein